MHETAILVVDSQKPFNRQVEKRLISAGYRVISEDALDDISERAYSEQVSLVVYNCMPPQEKVLEMIRRFKKDQRCKGMLIMMYSKLCANSGQMVAALEAGVDDYIVQPFDWRVFIARIKALLRRASFKADRSCWIKYKNITLNSDSRIVQVNGKAINLTPKEFGLLCRFIEKQGSVLDRAFLMESVWEYSYFGTTRTVDKHVENLRNKLGKAGAYIQTIERVGYKLG